MVVLFRSRRTDREGVVRPLQLPYQFPVPPTRTFSRERSVLVSNGFTEKCPEDGRVVVGVEIVIVGSRLLRSSVHSEKTSRTSSCVTDGGVTREPNGQTFVPGTGPERLCESTIYLGREWWWT